MARKMQRGRGGVEYEDIRVGTGEEVATREHEALVSYQICLHRGDCVERVNRRWIDLRRRMDVIEGIRYGTEGMRIGGIRHIVIQPHLGYGKRGKTWQASIFQKCMIYPVIPPNALLICSIELIDLRSSAPTPPKLKLARERKAAGIQVKPPRESKKKGRAG